MGRRRLTVGLRDLQVGNRGGDGRDRYDNPQRTDHDDPLACAIDRPSRDEMALAQRIRNDCSAPTELRKSREIGDLCPSLVAAMQRTPLIKQNGYATGTANRETPKMGRRPVAPFFHKLNFARCAQPLISCKSRFAVAVRSAPVFCAPNSHKSFGRIQFCE